MIRLPGRFARRGALLAAVMLLSACGIELSSSATVTPAPPTLPPPLVASPTTNPVAPLLEDPGIRYPEQGAAGVSNPTQAGLAAEGQPDQDLPTVTPRPTQAQLPMVISASDGLVLRATYYSAPVRPAPGILMLHQRGRDRTTWNALAQRLQAAGYALLTVDQRGYGATGGSEDWPKALDDARTALAMLADLPGISPGRLVVIGASVGANIGLNVCADWAGCGAAVLLSPGLDYRGITTAGAMARMGARPVLIAASENDRNNPADSITLDGMAAGDHQLLIYPDAGHGTDMLANAPDLEDQVVNWIMAHIPPPAANPEAGS